IDHRGKTPNKMGFDDFFLSGVPVLSAKHVKTDGLVDVQSMRYASTEMYKKWMTVEVQEGDIILTSEAPMGEVFYIQDDKKYVLGQRVFGLRPNPRLINPKYLAAWLASSEGQRQITARASGSTVQGIRQAELLKLEVDLPSREEQERIANVRFSLTDKISLNRRINQTLEAMAQAIFKSWFVDFDPVKAKIAAIEQGQDPLRAAMRAISGKTDAELDQMPREHHDQLAITAALFPDAMEDSELGEIPKGWGIKKLGAVTDYLNRGISPKYLEDGGVLVLNQKCIRDFRVDESKGRRHDPSQRKIDGRTLEVGDVLVNSTGVGTLGRVAQVLHLSEPTIVDSHVTVVRAGGEINCSYLGCYINWMQPDIEAMGEGSTGQTELSRLKLAELSMLTPCQDVLKAFDVLISSLTAEISEKERESVKLAELRDTLLPRLLSGKLRVPDTERIVEKV
ncbi:restriction endonuclease subunit S, partial [Pseudomonas aeruginosa]